MSWYRTHRRGFSLIELLVVIAIIAILAALLFPVFTKARERGQASSCLSNSRQIGLACVQYFEDNGDRFPLTSESGTTASWIFTLQPYIRNTAVYRCPMDTSRNWGSGSLDRRGVRHTSYMLNEWMVEHFRYSALSAIRNPASVVYISESAANRTGDHFHPFMWTYDPAQPGGPVSAMFDTLNGKTLELAINRHHGGLNNVYVDGHATWNRWEQLWFQKPGVYEGAFDPRQ